MSRFQKQNILPGFGKQAQKKLNESSVLLVGAGGLGCPALLYLAAAGIGKIGVADGDVIEESNLSRQVLYGENDIGKMKADIACKCINEKYSDVNTEPFNYRINTINVEEVIRPYFLVLDCTDNEETRYLLDEACAKQGKALVYGAVHRYQGQVSVFRYNNGAGYRDWFPETEVNENGSCTNDGVWSILPGQVGLMMATEAVKIISGCGLPLSDKLWVYDALSGESSVHLLR